MSQEKLILVSQLLCFKKLETKTKPPLGRQAKNNKPLRTETKLGLASDFSRTTVNSRTQWNHEYTVLRRKGMAQPNCEVVAPSSLLEESTRGQVSNN